MLVLQPSARIVSACQHFSYFLLAHLLFARFGRPAEFDLRIWAIVGTGVIALRPGRRLGPGSTGAARGPFVQSDVGALAVAKDGCAVARSPAEADETKSIWAARPLLSVSVVVLGPVADDPIPERLREDVPILGDAKDRFGEAIDGLGEVTGVGGDAIDEPNAAASAVGLTSTTSPTPTRARLASLGSTSTISSSSVSRFLTPRLDSEEGGREAAVGVAGLGAEIGAEFEGKQAMMFRGFGTTNALAVGRGAIPLVSFVLEVSGNEVGRACFGVFDVL
ncbi:hypothetical protein RhiTH_010447 [Rhizoctonia solani]